TLSALNHLADAGIVHNDIKPDNIMLDADTGDVKLIDFGLATEAAMTMNEDGQKVRKGGLLDISPFGYGVTPPEDYTGQKGETDTGKRGTVVTPKADVFGLGGIAHQVGEGAQHRYGEEAKPGRAGVSRDVFEAYAEGQHPIFGVSEPKTESGAEDAVGRATGDATGEATTKDPVTGETRTFSFD